MTPAEAAALLTIAAAYDNRKPDEDQARAWAFALEDLRFDDCREAVVRHYRQSREWLMPVEVVEGVKAIRHERWVKFHKDRTPGYLTPPRRFEGDPAKEQQWWHEVGRKIRDGSITTADELEQETDELVQRDVASLGLIGREIPAATRAAPRPTRGTDTEENESA